MTQQRTSTIPAALDALEDLYNRVFATASPEGNAVQVTQGTPKYAQRERIEITSVANATQDQATFGLGDRDEHFLVTGWVIVSEFPGSQRDCKNRAFELLAIAESALRVDDPFGWEDTYSFNKVDFAGVLSAVGGPLKIGWTYEISFSVRVMAGI